MRKFLIVILFLIGSLECSKDNNTTGLDKEEFIYPLKIGNKWSYSREYSIFNFRPDTIDIWRPDTTLSTSEIEIVRVDTLYDSIKTYVFHESLIEEGYNPYESESYYNNKVDGMYLYAYYGPGFVLPKPRAKTKIYFKGRCFNNVREVALFVENAIPIRYSRSDSIIYEHPPLLSLQYPLKIGSQWVYRMPDNPWAIDKKVLAKEDVRVPAGKFKCYKIQWLFDIDGNGAWDSDIEFFDYISTKGLVRRSILFKDLVVTGEESPEPIGMVDMKDEAQLIEVHLK